MLRLLPDRPHPWAGNEVPGVILDRPDQRDQVIRRGAQPAGHGDRTIHRRHLPIRAVEPVTVYGSSVNRDDLVLLRRARDQIDRDYASPLDVAALARTA